MKVRRIGGDPTTDAQSGSDGDSGEDEYASFPGGAWIWLRFMWGDRLCAACAFSMPPS